MKRDILMVLVLFLLLAIPVCIYVFLPSNSESNASLAYLSHRDKLKVFPTGAGKMAYLDEGRGSVILLVDGVPTSSLLYRKMVPMLVSEGYRVIAPDMVGYGDSDKPDDPTTYEADKMGRRLLELMDYLDVESWTQVYHDGGGLWTWEMLLQDAPRVDQLIMLNTIIYEAGFRPPIRFEEGRIAREYAAQYTTGMGRKMVISPTFTNGISNKSVISKAMLQGYKLPFYKQSSAALYHFFTQTCKGIPDYRALHRSFNIPTVVIWGKNDDILVWEKMSDDIIANLRVKEDDIHILDAKHFIQEEISAIIVQALK